jgi:hypothetical protein
MIKLNKATEARRAARKNAAKAGATRRIENKKNKPPRHRTKLEEYQDKDWSY